MPFTGLILRKLQLWKGRSTRNCDAPMPKDKSGEFERAFEAFLGGHYEEAAEAFQRSADCSQNDPDHRLHALSLKATCFARMGRPEAKALAEEVLAQQPDHFNARELLAALNASRPSQRSRLAACTSGHGRNGEPCRSYDEVCQRVCRLPTPPSGYTHVFRGQNREFGAMLPSGLRGKRLRGDAIWNCYSWHLGIDLKRHEPDCELDDYMLNFNVRAIAQHYGPGSEFLDVTRSKEVALWFALNEPKTCDVLCPEDPLPKLRDAPYALTRSGPVSVTRYRPTASGVLYVFLVPEWDGVGRPGHGYLIDLRKRAPRPFSLSEEHSRHKGPLDVTSLLGSRAQSYLPQRWPGLPPPPPETERTTAHGLPLFPCRS